MAKQHTIRDIDDLEFRTRSGEVVGSQNWSETKLHGTSSGGSGYVGPQGGHVAAPSVSVYSTTKEQLRLFIRGEDGKEFDIQMHNLPFGVREGHRVAIVYAKNVAGTSWTGVGFANRSTERHVAFDGLVDDFVPKSSFGEFAAGIICLPAIVGYLAYLNPLMLRRELAPDYTVVNVYPWWPLLTIVTALGWIFHSARRARRKGRLRRELLAQILSKVENEAVSDDAVAASR